MALKRNERYPGRFGNPNAAHPQGAFKNRTSPTSQDGSYLESDWANDWDGFFARLLTVAGVTPNGNVDTGTSSQYYDALVTAVKSLTTSGPGWVRFPDGTIIQRGTSISGNLTFPVAISFPIPYTSGFTVTTSFDKADNASTDCPAFATTPIGLLGFYLMSSRSGAGAGAGANWIAVGK